MPLFFVRIILKSVVHSPMGLVDEQAPTQQWQLSFPPAHFCSSSYALVLPRMATKWATSTHLPHDLPPGCPVSSGCTYCSSRSLLRNSQRRGGKQSSRGDLYHLSALASGWSGHSASHDAPRPHYSEIIWVPLLLVHLSKLFLSPGPCLVLSGYPIT